MMENLLITNQHLDLVGNYSDIIFVEFPPNLKVGVDEAKELVESRLSFARDTKHFLVIDISNVKEISHGAKELMQQNDTGLKNILGAAFIATNPVSVLIASIFIKTPSMAFEAKIFSNKKDAFEWILKYRERS